MTNILIDTDPGMDDALALALALKSDALEVRAITAVTGNLPSDRSLANVLKVLDLLGSGPIPVAQGPLVPRGGNYPSDPFSHGSDGLAESHFPDSGRAVDPRSAAQLIVDTVNAHAGDISLCCLGPLTNIAAALEIDSELPKKVSKIVVTGGSFGVTPYAWSQATGDNPVSEWNIFVDPESAQLVFRAGFDLLAVGLDVSTHPAINFRPHDMAVLRASPRSEAQLAARIVDFVESRGYQSYCSLIDSAVVATLIDPTLVEPETVKCDVETLGELTRGMTVVDRRMHHQLTSLPTIDIAASFDYERFLDIVTKGLCK
ncbi:nucleoside hydrolase [Arthrobacter sp. efr-133-R2A-120]|uniref:nucleoside hydrolase n=1 Tax=Arthrobacter sp. efr-133-R2A-120 TaxID=3040277 RepID=UPI00254E36B8|nr:nucleoside hydrolase [Arthrobacter sp. efr-133-R2A-120]